MLLALEELYGHTVFALCCAFIKMSDPSFSKGASQDMQSFSYSLSPSFACSVFFPPSDKETKNERKYISDFAAVFICAWLCVCECVCVCVCLFSGLSVRAWSHAVYVYCRSKNLVSLNVAYLCAHEEKNRKIHLYTKVCV